MFRGVTSQTFLWWHYIFKLVWVLGIHKIRILPCFSAWGRLITKKTGHLYFLMFVTTTRCCSVILYHLELAIERWCRWCSGASTWLIAVCWIVTVPPAPFFTSLFALVWRCTFPFVFWFPSPWRVWLSSFRGSIRRFRLRTKPTVSAGLSRFSTSGCWRWGCGGWWGFAYQVSPESLFHCINCIKS